MAQQAPPSGGRLPSTSQTQKPPHQRITRACDACRKMKIKCLLNGTGPCENCLINSRPCTFQDVGVKRERPPSKRDIEKLNNIIKSLELYLSIIAPNLNLNLIPDGVTSTVNQTELTVTHSKSNVKPQNDPTSVVPSIKSLHLPSTSPKQLTSPFSQFTPKSNCQVQSIHSENFYPPSMVESHLAAYHSKCTTSILDVQLPPTELADSLISLFFNKVNQFDNIIHEAEFLAQYSRGLARQNASFCALCFVIFAAGARFSSDPRVFCSTSNQQSDRQAVGANYLASSTHLLSPCVIPCTLFDLQAMALLCYMTTSSCSPLTAWFSTRYYLRRALDSGAHREATARWKTSIMTDQLRKRAMWYLVSREIQLCMCLGRPSFIKHEELDLVFPFCVNDRTLSMICNYASQKNIKDCHELEQAYLDSFEVSPSFIAFKAFLEVKLLFGRGLQKILATSGNLQQKAWNWGTKVVSALAREIDAHLNSHIPCEARWSPEIKNTQEFMISARLNGGSLSLQIAIHRLLIRENPLEIKVCLHASSALLNILEHLRSRGLLEETTSWSPYMVTLPALTFLYAACCELDCILPGDQANAWADVHRCINILNAMSSTTFLADKLSASLDHLVQACIEDELFPEASRQSQNSKKRDALSIIVEDDPSSSCPTTKPGSLKQLNHFEPKKSGAIYPASSNWSSANVPDLNSTNISQVWPPGLNFFSIPPSQLDATLFENPGMNINSCFPVRSPPWCLQVDYLHPSLSPTGTQRSPS